MTTDPQGFEYNTDLLAQLEENDENEDASPLPAVRPAAGAPQRRQVPDA